MDNPSLPTAIMGAATSVITLGVVLLKGLRSRRVMPREPHVNRESVQTVHRYFRHVLRAILQLYKHMIREPDKDIPLEIRNSSRFNSYFKDCVGAIDGTHVRASVPIQIQGRFSGQNDGTTQNVLAAAAAFDLKFTYVLVGKYYLSDAGYGVRKGIISPYRGVRYHLKEFSDNPPRNDKELFNLRHSSLRTSIERCFGVLKKRFRVLDAKPFWSFPTQVDVVLACCIIHNHIIGVDPLDSIMSNGLHGSPLANDSTSRRVQQSQREVQEENREWIQKWDDICHKMWEDYNAME
ncbi:protein ANTAGONIST OF LIKE HETEROCHROMATIN PROTEIN 1-like [Quercus lobata]|uniref:protein ANTAGONIST OF LIKE HETEROCHROMATIN PROTEIN 1-like n=1 Tax=Quercus lobata TaxID=97700 RepID=UPI00124560A6|nr:protein ANTAGONIST OF LIKE HETEROCHROMATIN PROTEIN 1-like [Quercus lobata]